MDKDKYKNKCLLATKCKKVNDPRFCNELCYAFVRAHGEKGAGGVFGIANVPKAYRKALASNLPYKAQNPEAYRMVTLYCKSILSQVEKGAGLYLFGRSGNGKTTTAATVLNEYLAARIIQEVKKEGRIDDVPALFVNASKYQNQFNAMFRGTKDAQEVASEKYYRLKNLMSRVSLLVVDDIGVRDATEAFKGEFYQVIDDRATEQLATIYTSNVTLEKLAIVLDERIASRIKGSVIPVRFIGEDKREDAFWREESASD